MKNTITFVLAGGKGERLLPLTQDRAKPAVPFGGAFCIIDFTLSNCLNSGLRRIFVLTQYKSTSLQRHLRHAWDIFDPQLDEFIDIVPAQQRIGDVWYRGTADAVYQNIYTIEQMSPEYVLILAGDHVYKMNYQEMINFHMEKNADLTVGIIRFKAREAHQLGILKVDASSKITDFVEKPKRIPFVDPENKKYVLSSMGIYFFRKDVLEEELGIDVNNPLSSHDFGKNIIPQMLKRKRRVYGFKFNGYWQDIGTRDALYEANLALCQSNPALDLFDESWPVRTYQSYMGPSKLLGSRNVKIKNSMICSGAILNDCHIQNSIISSKVVVQKGCRIRDSIIMENTKILADTMIKKSIIDKHCVIGSNLRIGYNKEEDRQRFSLTTKGVVVISRGTKVSQ